VDADNPARPAASGIEAWLELAVDGNVAAASGDLTEFPGAVQLADAYQYAALYLGGLGLSVGVGSTPGWGRLSVTADAAALGRLRAGRYGTPSDDDTIRLGGLLLQLAETKPDVTESAGSAGTDGPGSATPVADELGLAGPAAIRVASFDGAAAAAELAELFGVTVRGYHEPAINAAVYAVPLGRFAVEFVSSLTGAGADRTGSFLAGGGERIQSLALPMADLHLVRDLLIQQELPFSQWGSSVLAVPGQILAPGTVELSTTLAGQR
jgi:hypothetical protein